MQNKSSIGERIRQYRLFEGSDQSQFAIKIHSSQQQLSKYENSYVEPSSKFYAKMCELTDINLNWLLTGEGEMLRTTSLTVNINDIDTNNNSSDELANKSFVIPYYEGNDKLKKPGVTEAVIDMQVIVREWGCNPEDLRIISTPGEEMDGGKYPIRNNDILVIDISKTNISDSGVYLVSTNHGELVALRRLMELIDGSVAFYVDNEYYARAINKTASREELEAMDFTVIGRVVKNVSYTL